MKTCQQCGHTMFDADINAEGLCKKCEGVKEPQDYESIAVCKKCKQTFKKYLLLSNGMCANCDKMERKQLKNNQQNSGSIISEVVVLKDVKYTEKTKQINTGDKLKSSLKSGGSCLLLTAGGALYLFVWFIIAVVILAIIVWAFRVVF